MLVFNHEQVYYAPKDLQKRIYVIGDAIYGRKELIIDNADMMPEKYLKTLRMYYHSQIVLLTVTSERGITPTLYNLMIAVGKASLREERKC
jgi:hypothetical protein